MGQQESRHSPGSKRIGDEQVGSSLVAGSHRVVPVAALQLLKGGSERLSVPHGARARGVGKVFPAAGDGQLDYGGDDGGDDGQQNQGQIGRASCRERV